MDEVFEKKHFITNFVWTRKRKGSFLSKKIRKMTEFIICFSKSEGDLSLFGEDAYSDKWQPIVKRTNSLKKLNFPKNIIKTTLKDGIYEKLYRGNNETGISFLNDFNVKDGLIVNDIEVEGKFVWTQQFLDNELINGSEISLSNKFGFNVLIAHDIPAINPAPPIGTTTISTFGTSSIISIPIVPAPANIGGSSYPLI